MNLKRDQKGYGRIWERRGERGEKGERRGEEERGIKERRKE